MGRLKRWSLIASALLLLALVSSAYFFPYLLKRYIERNSGTWIDRRVTIGSIVLNPFTGVYAVNDFVCHEPESEQVFVRFGKLGIKGSVLDGLMNDHWSFREAELREPYIRIEQAGDQFNFSDLLELGGADGSDEAEQGTSSNARFAVREIALTDGRIDYLSDLLLEPLQVIDLRMGCDLITSANARMAFELGLGLPDGTRLDGAFVIDTDSARYTVEAHLRDLNLSSSLPYLQDFFDAGLLNGMVDVDLRVRQRYSDGSALALSATADIRELLLRDPRQDHLLSLKHLHARLDTLDDEHFELGVVAVDGLDVRFALMADSTDNWTRLLKLAPDSTGGEEHAMTLDVSESNYFALLAEYISYLGSTVTGSQYTADSLVLSNGRLLFEDHSLPRSFSYDISNIELRAQRFNASSPVAPVSATARLNDAGRVEARAEFDTKDFRNVYLLLRVDSLMLSQLDPYTRWYAAHPVADGVLSYMSSTTIKDGVIDSRNMMHVDRLKFGKPVDEHYPDIYLLPLRLAAGLLKDAKGVVELDVPVKGDLRDPQFRAWPIIWQILKNLVVKAVTAPAKMIGRMFEGADEKDLELVRFRELQGHLEKPQRRALDLLAQALATKPELTVDLVSVVDSLQEAGELALYTAKARYLFPDKPLLTAKDSADVLALAPRDSSFVQWMDAHVPGTSDLPMTQRSVSAIGPATVQRSWSELEQARRESVMQVLLASGTEPARVRFRPGTKAEVAPFKGLPGYRFVYDVMP